MGPTMQKKHEKSVPQDLIYKGNTCICSFKCYFITDYAHYVSFNRHFESNLSLGGTVTFFPADTNMYPIGYKRFHLVGAPTFLPTYSICMRSDVIRFYIYGRLCDE